MERRALYNSLRINWQLDPTLDVEPWQVEDYRLKSIEELFQELNKLNLRLDHRHFLAFCDEMETPEDLADMLVSEGDEEDQSKSDQIYLIVFELWRRLVPEKQTLSLFCDEFDHLIDLYDAGRIESPEPIEDVISGFIELLSERNDKGEDPQALFESVLQGCAHDVEGFLYDFIAMQIEAGNIDYASDLVEAFLPYAIDTRWFWFLHAQVSAESDQAKARQIVHDLIKECKNDPETGFNLELLAYLAKTEEERPFLQLKAATIPLLETEEDFWDLLSSIEDFYHFKDRENEEKLIADLRKRRHQNDPAKPLSSSDPDLLKLL
jgi:hypothetical protein